ncbi:MAG: type II toxin-antitoxin system VapC family toxin [Verrucomicrobiota bacterium]
MAETVFIETTIPSYYVARPSRDIVQAARQQLTIEWWTFHRPRFDIFSSQSVIAEASRGDSEMAEARLQLMADVPLLSLDDLVGTVAQHLLDDAIIPEKAAEDAIHISCAAVHNMDYLLTWNCRHIANPQIRRRIREVLEGMGIAMPVICTPEEFVSNE